MELLGKAIDQRTNTRVVYLVAYLTDISASQYGEPGTFSRNYFLAESSRLEEYKDHYMAGSSVWGGFQHILPQKKAQVVTSNSTISAARDIQLPSDIHVEIAARSVAQTYAFERYMRLYHLLELSFDQDIVQRIRGLGPDLNGIGRILSAYDANELARLKQIISRCRRPTAVADQMRILTSDPRWHDRIRAIFFDFGKDGNPIPAADEDEFMAILATSGYTGQNLRKIASIQGGRWTPESQRKFEAFSLKLAAYWIYRIRSSIVHSRIGEYVMRSDDEAFVSHFAEPLIRSVLIEIL